MIVLQHFLCPVCILEFSNLISYSVCFKSLESGCQKNYTLSISLFPIDTFCLFVFIYFFIIIICWGFFLFFFFSNDIGGMDTNPTIKFLFTILILRIKFDELSLMPETCNSFPPLCSTKLVNALIPKAILTLRTISPTMFCSNAKVSLTISFNKAYRLSIYSNFKSPGCSYLSISNHGSPQLITGTTRSSHSPLILIVQYYHST